MNAERRADPIPWRAAASPWLVGHIAVLVGFAAAFVIAGDAPPHLPIHQGYISWDATWYYVLASVGYEHAPAETLRFFPLLPLLGRWFAAITALPLGAALGVIVHVFSYLATVGVGMVAGRFGTARTASASMWAFALWPTAFVLSVPYTESLLLVFACGFVIALDRRHPIGVFAAGMLAGLTRPVGLLLVGYAAIWLWRRRDRSIPLWLSASGPAVGMAIFLRWSASTGRGFWGPADAQSEFRGNVRDPVRRLVDAVGSGDTTDFGHGIVFVACIALLVMLWRSDLWAMASYGAVGTIIAFSSSNLNSFLRYEHGLLPVVLAAGMAIDRTCARFPKPWVRAALAATAAGLVALTTTAILLHRYVP